MRCKMSLKKFEESGHPRCTNPRPDAWNAFRNPYDDPFGVA
jgi:hypothetical protein